MLLTFVNVISMVFDSIFGFFCFSVLSTIFVNFRILIYGGWVVLVCACCWAFCFCQRINIKTPNCWKIKEQSPLQTQFSSAASQE